MNLKILNKSDKTLKFVLETDAGFANALRRTMTADVPIMAIENVTIEENRSGIFDEAVAHRLGMIPMAFDSKLYNLKDECPCGGKGCSRCEVTLVLEKTGPCIVRAGEMKSTADDVKPADANIPIVELLENQKLKFEAIAQLGLGIDHIKWQASHTGYRYKPIVKLKPDADNQKAYEVCPAHVFDKKDGKIRVANDLNCVLCMRCVEMSDASVSTDDTSFIFEVESVSGLSARDIIETALDVLENNTQEFASDFKKSVK